MGELISNFTNSVLMSEYSVYILLILAFTESSFFPIPPDTVLIPLALLQPHMAIILAIVTTIASVLGGAFGYFIGDKGGKKIVYKIIPKEKLAVVRDYYNKYDVWAVVIAAFTPIPYKFFTIAAGLFDLNFKRFIIASIIGRGGRFLLVGVLIYVFGPVVKSFLSQYLEVTIIMFTVLLVGGFLVVNHVFKKKKQSI